MGGQPLPAQDQAVFRSIVKFYETKQYKKGVKAADSILKKHPNHGETLCMKGLTLSYLDKQEEAYKLVREGVKYDLRSHVCWHVYGLLYSQDKDYFEAVKCYRQALRIDPENIQILRDLSQLQIHRRDLPGFAETRKKLLQVKPSQRLNWIGYAVSEHLCKGYEFAWTCLDNYEKTFKDESVPDYETSELYFYKASIMEEAGQLEQALECVLKHEKDIVDKLGMNEMKGRLLMFLGRFDEASEVYRNLVKGNPEHHIYVLGYLANQTRFHKFWPPMPAPLVPEGGAAAEPLPASIGSFPPSLHPSGSPVSGWLRPQHSQRPRVLVGKRLLKQRFDVHQPVVPMSDEDEEAVCVFFDDLQAQHPRADSMQRLLLNFITGQRFVDRLDRYLRPKIRKAIPALSRMLRPLYFQANKAPLIESLLSQYLEHLPKEFSTFGPGAGLGEDDAEEAPQSLLFTYFMATEHYDFLGDTSKALEYSNKAIKHTPTLVELYGCQARIYKRAGDLEKSCSLFDEARQMDLADRFLNCQAVKGFIRIDNVQAGMEKALLFSKEPDSLEAANLHEMQCMWYESAVGRSYVRQRNFGKALKMFHQTFKHFSDIAEDQFDFHNYCLRKTTLKTYVAMLKMQDGLYAHKFFRRSAKDAIKVYVEVFDMAARGEKVGIGKDDDKEEAEMSAAEKKKLKHKQKRDADKKKAEEALVQAAEKKVPAGGKPKKVDDDPDGDKLLEKEPMEEAGKLLKLLVTYAGNDAATHVLQYEVFSRQSKLLHCLQALIRLWTLSGQDPTHYKVVHFLAHFCFVQGLEGDSVHGAVREVVFAELAPVLGQAEAFKDVNALRAAATKVVDAAVARCSSGTVTEVLATLKAMKHAGKDSSTFLKAWKPAESLSLKEASKMSAYLAATCGKDSEAHEGFKAVCRRAFPLMDLC